MKRSKLRKKMIRYRINIKLLKKYGGYEKKKISFQGLKGAYSALACRKFYHEYETYPCSTFEQILEAVNKNKAELALIPVKVASALEQKGLVIHL